MASSRSGRLHHQLIILYIALILLALITLTVGLEAPSKERVALEQSEYISELRQTTVVMAINTTQPEAIPKRCNWESLIEKEKASLLRRLKVPAKKENYTPTHIRYRLLVAIDGFQRYRERAEGMIQMKREMFQGLSGEQAELVNRIAGYQEKFTAVLEGIRRNAQIAENIAKYALEFYNIDAAEVTAFSNWLVNEGRSSDHTSVAQSLKHYVRDWSEDGIEETQPVFPPILETLQDMFPVRNVTPVRVLIPGSGLGRLAHEVDQLGGFDVTSNEYSAYMNLAYHYIASLSTLNSLTLNPYIDSWSHQPTTSELLREVPIPSLLTSTHRVLHVEGDFTTAFRHHSKFDFIITLFFIDTARNLLHYFETIRDLLKPGGKWINLGPLLYGSRPMVELSLDEIVGVVEEMGFAFEEGNVGERWGRRTLEGREVWGWEARYGLNPRMLTKNSYMVQFWVARRGEK